MSSQEFQSAHTSIHQLGTDLLHYLQELRSGKLSEGDSTKGLSTVENDVQTALQALASQKYQVAVIAAMKAGKSTFLNALIGADILASESEACTICRTDVKPIENGRNPRLLEYREGQKEPFLIADGDVSKIRDQFLERTRQIRKEQNSDKTIRFELEHPIEAISKLSSLKGFTLVDTPGPNEWQSAEFDTVNLKRTALEALRTCDAILFILDYSSFRDDTNSELLTQLIEQRQEALKNNTGKLYFILNKVDKKAQRDRPIEDVIENLRKSLNGFGIPDPIIYPASAWLGLLAKLIKNNIATQEHQDDFDQFFIGRYIYRDESGNRCFRDNLYELALQDSNIPKIEESVIQTVVRNSGWNLLNDVLNSLNKAAQFIEDSLNIQIQGWEIEFEALKNKVEEYRKKSENAKEKVESVKCHIKNQKEKLVQDFSQGLKVFADQSKTKIVEEINGIGKTRDPQTTGTIPIPENSGDGLIDMIGDIVDGIGDLAGTVLENFPIPFGKVIGKISRDTGSLVNHILRKIPGSLENSMILVTEERDPFIFKLQTQEEAQELLETINNYCSPHLQDWWIYTQDELIRYGTSIRQKLVEQIQNDIQMISDELSEYLGESLQVQLNVNPIQFPDFEFEGIDSRIESVIENVITQRLETRTDCFRKYTIDIPVEQEQKYY